MDWNKQFIELRKAQGITLEAAGKVLGIGRSAYLRREQLGLFSIPELELIASLLGRRLSITLEEADKQPVKEIVPQVRTEESPVKPIVPKSGTNKQVDPAIQAMIDARRAKLGK